MATKLLFKKSGKPVEAGLEVTIKWDRAWFPIGGGSVRTFTDNGGYVYISDSLLRCGSRKTETVNIRSPEGYWLTFVNIVLSAGEQQVFLLEAAQREWTAEPGE